MTLISTEVWVKLGVRNMAWYEGKGYVLPRRIDRHGKYSLPQSGSIILVKIEDLQPSCDARITYQCDGCKLYFTTPWSSYIAHLHADEKYYCQKCGNKLIAMAKKSATIINKKGSLYDFCFENSKMEVIERWDYDLNKIDPKNVVAGTKKKYYLRCPKNIHKSELKDIGSYFYGQEGSIRCNGCLSLGHNFPESYNVWSGKNEKSPDEYFSYTPKKVWWKCENQLHEDYYRKISDSVIQNFRCAKCVAERRESFAQQKVRECLEAFNYTILHERECTILPRNPITNAYLPYDNEIKELKGIIETHGKQHYEAGSWHNQIAKSRNITSEEAYEYCKWKDNFKKEFAISKLYNYLEIKWTETKTDNYKNKIENFISNIINLNWLISASLISASVIIVQ